MQETQARPLGWENSLEKGMATQSSKLAWRIPWIEHPGGLQSIGHRVGHDWAHTHLSALCNKKTITSLTTLGLSDLTSIPEACCAHQAILWTVR